METVVGYEPFPLDPVAAGDRLRAAEAERDDLAERVRDLEKLVGRLAERNGQLSQLLTRYANKDVPAVAGDVDADGEVD